MNFIGPFIQPGQSLRTQFWEGEVTTTRLLFFKIILPRAEVLVAGRQWAAGLRKEGDPGNLLDLESNPPERTR